VRDEDGSGWSLEPITSWHGGGIIRARGWRSGRAVAVRRVVRDDGLTAGPVAVLHWDGGIAGRFVVGVSDDGVSLDDGGLGDAVVVSSSHGGGGGVV